MAQRAELMTCVVSFRLTPNEKRKLDQLCRYARREQGELLRLLIQMAEPMPGMAVPLALVGKD